MATKKVLIIEDDPNLIDLLEIHLKDLNCDLEKAMDGQTGFDKASNGQFDLIVLDIMLPEMDGLEVCRSLRGK